MEYSIYEYVGYGTLYAPTQYNYASRPSVVFIGHSFMYVR